MGNLNYFWTFGVALMGFSSLLLNSSALDFGVCEITRPQYITTNLSTPYWINKTIQGCCKGFIKVENRCEPDCRNVTCINGHCIGNNMCECDDGYFASPTPYNCRPICDPPCQVPNAACQKPNVCQCRPRYKKANATFCEPICSFTEEEFECINSNCVAPNTCECWDGYKKDADLSYFCSPICQNCSNGDCNAPEECDCHDGYVKNEFGICSPVCSPPCVNAHCLAPNECACFENFEVYLDNNECLERSMIQERQDCQQTCKNGSCFKGKCICDYSYEMYNGKCAKICNKNCGAGRCLDNKCICEPQHRLENSTCVPICAFEDNHDCINGDCIAPNVCRCYDGYKFLDNRNCTCVPMCNPSCINAICTEDGCMCHEGFYNVSDYECAKNCSEGFIWILDECMEDISFDDSEEETTASTTEVDGLTSYEDESSGDVDDDDFENTSSKMVEKIDEDGLDASGDVVVVVNENDVISAQEKELFFITLMVVLSVVVVLLISILITFCVLYQYIFPKHIYFVQEKEMSSNCVYFSNKPGNGQIRATEFNI